MWRGERLGKREEEWRCGLVWAKQVAKRQGCCMYGRESLCPLNEVQNKGSYVVLGPLSNFIGSLLCWVCDS